MAYQKTDHAAHGHDDARQRESDNRPSSAPPVARPTQARHDAAEDHDQRVHLVICEQLAARTAARVHSSAGSPATSLADEDMWQVWSRLQRMIPAAAVGGLLVVAMRVVVAVRGVIGLLIKPCEKCPGIRLELARLVTSAACTRCRWCPRMSARR